jgi:hypothetical protein
MSSGKMQREYTDNIKMAGAELSAQAILDILRKNSHVRSGMLGVNDKLEIVSHHFFNEKLKLAQINSSIDEASCTNATGVVFFDVFEGNVFVADSRFIAKLNSICESGCLTLIDLMLFGSDDWMSLRQQNRI